MHQIKFVIPFLFCLFYAEEKTKEEWWYKKATVMVEKQIERRGVKDPRVLKVMREIPRHRFIPPHLEKMAYN
jgi:protein-L-isoaspartate(D-aspartate) O-methyltransferase